MNNIQKEIPYIECLPKDWRVIPNRFLFKESKEKVGNNFNDYQLLSLTTKGIKEKEINSSGGKVPASYENYQKVSCGQMIFCLFDLDCSAVFSGLSSFDGMITSAYNVYNSERYIDNRYANYWFQYVFSNRYYKMYSKNIRYTISDDTFKSIKTPVPPKDEQIKISNVLDKKCSQIDELIAIQEQEIEKLKAYKQSLITEVVTKGLDPDVEMRDSGVEWIGQVPNNWSLKPLKYLFTFSKGLSITKEDLREDGVPVISYGQIHAKWNSGVTLHEELKRYVSEDYLNIGKTSLAHKGDFIFADTSEDLEGCGNCAYIDEEESVFAGYHTILLRPTQNFDTKYLAYLFLSDVWRSQIRQRVYGIKLFSITQKILKSLDVIIPDNSEEIVKYLDKKCARLDNVVSIKQQKIDFLNDYRRSLIYEYVTGKKEVSDV